jgi:transducin (beta)-like 1
LILLTVCSEFSTTAIDPAIPMAVSMDEMNFLVWRYMQENGFPHSAFVFDTESVASSSNISGSQIPPGALVTLLQKSLIYLKIEKKIREARRDSSSPVSSAVAEITSLFPATIPDSASAEGFTPQVLNASNSNSLQSGNPTPVSAMLWSPDGQKLGTVHADGCAAMWIGKSRDLVQVGKGGRLRSRALAWSPKSELLAITADSDTPLFTLTGDLVVSIPVAATAVAFAVSDPAIAVCSAADFSIGLWSVNGTTPTQHQRFAIHQEPIGAIVASKLGFATASSDKCVGLITMTGTPTTRVLRGHTLGVNSIQFVGQSLVSGGEDGALFVWRGGQQSAVLRGHSGGIAALAAHPTGQIVASASVDGSVKVWDLSGAGECVASMGRHPRGATAVAFHPKGEILASGGRDGILGLWKWKDGKMMAAFTCGAEISAVSFDKKGEFAAVVVDLPIAMVVRVGTYVK